MHAMDTTPQCSRAGLRHTIGSRADNGESGSLHNAAGAVRCAMRGEVALAKCEHIKPSITLPNPRLSRHGFVTVVRLEVLRVVTWDW